MCDSNSKGTCKCVSVSQQFFCVFRHDKFGMKHTLIIHFTFARRIPTNNTIPTYFILKKKKNGSFITSLWKKRRINMLLTNEKKEVERERKIVRRERESERKKHTLLSEKLSDVQ